MRRQFLLIDGYNLMHAAGLARRRYGPGDLERSRNQLIAWLRAHLNRRTYEDAVVVFDARDAPSDVTRQFDVDGLQVVFAPPRSDADTDIEQRIAGHSSPRQLVVVSSDHRIQKAANRRRAKYVDSEVFAEELEQAAESDAGRPPGPPAVKTQGALSPDETDMWLREFGEIPEAGELRRPSDSDPMSEFDDVEPLG